MPGKIFSSSEAFDWLRLFRSENVGPRTFHELIKLYGSASLALENLHELAHKGGLKRIIKIATAAQIENELAAIEKYGAHLCCSFAAEYPKLLKELTDHPPVITYLGELTKLNSYSMVAIVGSRSASTSGSNFALELSATLARHKIGVVSGLARGIDTAAHKGSLSFFSAAVIAGGVNHIYPSENERLYHKLAEQGAIISELPINSAPLARHFPQRNRLISGLAKAVAIIEAVKHSGSLITAQYALAQKRLVFAVPGSPLDARASGTNYLIKNGALLLESADDIISRLNSIEQTIFADSVQFDFKVPPSLPSESELQKYRKQLLSALSFVPTNLEDISAHTQIPLSIVNLLVLELELAGKLQRTFGNRVCLLVEIYSK